MNNFYSLSLINLSFNFTFVSYCDMVDWERIKKEVSLQNPIQQTSLFILSELHRSLQWNYNWTMIYHF